MLEKLPNRNLDDAALEERLNTELSLNLEGLNDVELIYVIYNVNCKGEVYEYNISTLKKEGKIEMDSTSAFSQSLKNLLTKGTAI